LNAVDALRRMSYRKCDQFPVLPWDFSVFSADDSVQGGPRLKFNGSELFHIAKQLEIVFVVVMVGHLNHSPSIFQYPKRSMPSCDPFTDPRVSRSSDARKSTLWFFSHIAL